MASFILIGFVIGIGRIRAALFHVRLGTIELRRRRGHIGECLARRAIGLRGGAAQLIGIGDDIAESARPHATLRMWRTTLPLTCRCMRLPGK